MTRPAQVCNVPGCPRTALREGKCEEHKRPAWRDASTRKATLPADWRTRRLAILERDDHRCQCEGCARCTGGTPCRAPGIECDHIGDRLDHSPANLRAICVPCHRHKTSKRGRGA